MCIVLCHGEASNPGTWTGSKITFGQTCLSSLPLYLSTLPETGPNFTPFVSFEPSTRYSWAGQCHSQFCTTESVLSTYVIEDWTTFAVSSDFMNKRVRCVYCSLIFF